MKIFLVFLGLTALATAQSYECARQRFLTHQPRQRVIVRQAQTLLDALANYREDGNNARNEVATDGVALTLLRVMGLYYEAINSLYKDFPENDGSTNVCRNDEECRRIAADVKALCDTIWKKRDDSGPSGLLHALRERFDYFKQVPWTCDSLAYIVLAATRSVSKYLGPLSERVATESVGRQIEQCRTDMNSEAASVAELFSSV